MGILNDHNVRLFRIRGSYLPFILLRERVVFHHPSWASALGAFRGNSVIHLCREIRGWHFSKVLILSCFPLVWCGWTSYPPLLCYIIPFISIQFLLLSKEKWGVFVQLTQRMESCSPLRLFGFFPLVLSLLFSFGGLLDCLCIVSSFFLTNWIFFYQKK